MNHAVLIFLTGLLGYFLVLVPLNGAAELLYKCKSNNGRLYYQDRQCQSTQSVSSWEMNTAKLPPGGLTQPDQAGAYVVVQVNKYNAYQLQGLINDTPVQMIVDTGASLVSVPHQIADQLHLGCDSKVPLHTANGMTLACTGNIKTLQIGSMLLHNIEATVLPNDDSTLVLLGGSALKHLNVEQHHGEMRISEP